MNIHWFKQDLRINDNKSLYETSLNSRIFPIYIYDTTIDKAFEMGSASKWWLNNSLIKLNESLNNNLSFYKGDPKKIILELTKKYEVNMVSWNRSYEPWQIKRDEEIKKILTNNNIQVKSFNSFLLWEPELITKNDLKPYKVFTPFFQKGCLKSKSPKKPLGELSNLIFFKDKKSRSLKSLNFLPKVNWFKKLEKYWEIGEKNALINLDKFINRGLSDYKEGRNFPSKKNVSRLSPHIHFGEISINKIWFEIEKQKPDKNLDHFKSELGWRGFSYNLLYHYNELTLKNFQKKFNFFPWKYDKNKFSA